MMPASAWLAGAPVPAVEGVAPSGSPFTPSALETSLALAHGFTLGDICREHRRSIPTRTAMVCGADRIDYRQLDVRVNRLANALRDEGCGPGSVVAWLGQNCHRVMELLLACAKVGSVLCPVNWRGSGAEQEFVLRDLAPRLIIWQEEELGAAHRELRTTVAGLTAPDGATTRWIRHDDDGPDGYEAWLMSYDDEDPEPPINPFGAVLVIYTGAFTGNPHPAALNHLTLSLRALCEAMANGINHDFVYLNNGPMFHVGNWRTTMPTFLLGGKNVFVRRVEPSEMCQQIESERCTAAYMVPVTRERLEEHNADGRYDLSSLRDSGGTPAWQAMTSPGPSFTGYGQTEVGGMVSTTAFGPPGLGAAGRAIPLVQVRVLDDHGGEVVDGNVGEIAVRGLTVMNGYLNRPELCERRFRDGWWRTGDLGRRESDGSLTFVGPNLHMVKSGSENIYPAEVELCLRSHPDVADVAVIGVPDDEWVQSVKAIVVLKPGAVGDPAALQSHCREFIASYKKPRWFEFVDELPRTGGVVDRERLDADFGGGGYPGEQS